MTDRKPEEFEDDKKKWKIYFDLESNEMRVSELTICVRFMINRTGTEYPHLREEDINELKQDLRDLGKFRIIKQGKDFLEK